jgi:hypothetical protein
MSTAQVTPTRARVQSTDPLEQILDRQRELILQREYQVLGTIDFIWVVRGTGLLKIDYRKSGPRLAFNPETGDMLLLSPWNSLPDLPLPEAQPCQACLGTCGDCQGEGKKPCTLAGCAGSGYVKTKFGLCPDCLGNSRVQKTLPNCKTCKGRGEVPQPEKCKGCDANGQAQCAPCRGLGKVATGRAGGKKDGIDAATRTWIAAPACKACNGLGRTVQEQAQDWRQFVNGRLGNRVALGPIQRILWHTPGVGSQFQEAQISPDNGGNLMVLLLEGEQPGATQHLIGGIPQIK